MSLSFSHRFSITNKYLISHLIQNDRLRPQKQTRSTPIAFRCCGPKSERPCNARSRLCAFGTEIKLDPPGKRARWNIASLALPAYGSDSSMPQLSFSSSVRPIHSTIYGFRLACGNFFLSPIYKFCFPVDCHLIWNTEQGRLQTNMKYTRYECRF